MLTGAVVVARKTGWLDGVAILKVNYFRENEIDQNSPMQ